ncbi:nuclear transport factor 2 family protein [Geobacter sp.]|uniref:nuclear transport factor 2 family protein n=1 Tax=Geobacter sp. TaxID=46610 RepID=UPI002616A590|nr:nuclear transport factor 2 family protein [Geobacter sp.]
MKRILPLIALLALAGCSPQQRAVEEVMALRVKSLATADAPLYASLLSPAYRDKGKDFAAERAELERMIRGFGPVSYRSLGRTVAVNGPDATVTGRYAMKVTFRGRPLELTGEETLRLRRESGGWKIVGGL